jgi:RecA-family ATPase
LLPQEVTTIANSIGRYAPAQDGIDDDDLDVMPRGESALELMEREMELITYLCEPWIPEGLNLLAGRPKIGKTTMQRQKLAAVAEGGLLFGDRCLASPAVYLSLEEGDRLTRQKLESAAFSRDALVYCPVN